jgi:hypothetical protein
MITDDPVTIDCIEKVDNIVCTTIFDLRFKMILKKYIWYLILKKEFISNWI